MRLGGWTFTASAPDVDETRLPDEHPADYVRRLAEKKARALPGEALVIAADTIVADGGQVLGKPSDAAEAAAMLRQLSGRTHQVYTGIALSENGDILSTVRRTEVTLRPFSAAEIQAYVQSGDPLDKAGAYAIQNRDFQPVASFEGCLANVMGLPLCDLSRLLGKRGVATPQDVAANCQAYFGQPCPYYEKILHED